MTLKLETIVEDVLRRAEDKSRFIIAIAGPPGAGKSTLAEALCGALVTRGEAAAVLPMDGFHMDNGILEERGLLPRKGAPETFDVRGFLDIVSAVRQGGQEVLVPVFDRSREIAIASARAIAPETRFILAEGNYLLLNEAPWTKLSVSFDLAIFVGPSVAVLEDRLRQRWQGYGLDATEIHAKLFENDLPNGKRVIENSRPADIHIDIWE
ncbi:nucleoside triphosphate hydrolase [Agrobacterium arsenijevicii]|uniref:Nucleoside triphosphate hydrolase n=1 Tax=Agrobacterium arsenijevicii TaxID=1585697 RepID=A0ABR5DEK2_9HYPH|nr:nucleoside triphosphate hydrolase [Agrobacterium arsenijevicii]